MRLVELEPRWVERDGRRVGFVFRAPNNRKCWQSCFAVAIPRREQWKLLQASVPRQAEFQACDPNMEWIVSGGIENADFETMTVTPSLDGSKGGNWHGFITNGDIVGGI